jgi:hypothetical protein
MMCAASASFVSAHCRPLPRHACRRVASYPPERQVYSKQEAPGLGGRVRLAGFSTGAARWRRKSVDRGGGTRMCAALGPTTRIPLGIASRIRFVARRPISREPR